jgi:arylsulfatase A-like enzyme
MDLSLRRRDLLRSAPFAVPALKVRLAQASTSVESVAGMNVILFLTDQERAIQHFPPGWEERNLPGMTRLRRYGLSFDRAFCNSCMCSPSRATLFTGYFPAQHGVVDTLSFGTRFSPDEQVLPRDLPNMATVFEAAGYDVAYKGKWHLSKPLGDPDDPRAWAPADVATYGFDRWDPPDAGENRDISQFGGGDADNDGRIMGGRGDANAGEEGVLQYLRSVAPGRQPFFLVVSLVNPHDVLAYPRIWQDGGYDSDPWLDGEIDLPPTVDEDLSTKPAAQRRFNTWTNLGLGPLRNAEEQRNYVNFYGNLIKAADAALVEVLDTLDETGLLDNTLIVRTSDHGELGMAHGGMRQKSFNVYEESLRVPLVFSNPLLFPEPRVSDALVSHVDLLPTLASLIDAPDAARDDWQGVDYSALLQARDPSASPVHAHVQDDIVFTYDDLRCAQNVIQLVPPPNRIVSVRETRYKLARYYDGDGIEPDQWEMYDLENDPEERVNLAFPAHTLTAEQSAARERLTAKLRDVEATRLQPL